jgi:acetolactate synthase-1/2/3 large subunit
MLNLYGGEALIRALEHEGVRTVFGIPGLGQYEAIDALYQRPSVRYVGVRNEQAATYMADGYARASGEIAAALVLPGPGVLNATAGMATAYAVSAPMLVITGIDHQREGQDETRPVPLLQELTKWSGRAHTVAEVPGLVHTAMQQLRSGRPRPVALEVPHAVLAARGPVEFPDPAQTLRPGADPAALDQAVARMRAAQRPLIWAGGGVHTADAADLVTALAEAWHAPVVTSRSGKGAISARHPLALGYAELRYAPLRQWVDESDVILVLGTSANLGAIKGQIIQVDIDPAQLAVGEKGVGLVGDLQTVLTDLLAHQAEWVQDRPDPTAAVAALNAARLAPADQLQPQWGFNTALRSALPDDAIVAFDMTQMGYYSRNYFPVYRSRTYLHPSRLWTLGAAFPLALGAKVAQPNRVVAAVLGDGGFLYNAQELATAVQYEIPIITLVFNDNAFGNVLRAQQEEFDGHVLATKLHNPDFVRLAESYGVEAWRANDADELAAALQQAQRAEGPTLIEIPVGPMQRAY